MMNDKTQTGKIGFRGDEVVAAGIYGAKDNILPQQQTVIRCLTESNRNDGWGGAEEAGGEARVAIHSILGDAGDVVMVVGRSL